MTLSLFVIFLLTRVQDSKAQGGLELSYCISTALERDPQILVERKRIEIAEGQHLASQGNFDTLLQANAQADRDKVPLASGNEAVTDTHAIGAQASKQFRSGVTLSSNIDLTRKDPQTSGVQPENRTAVRLTVSYPLLQSHGRNLVTATEQAAQRQYEASLQELRHTVSERVVKVTFAYFDYLNARDTLEILRRSHQRGAQMVDETARLIEADELPANELLSIKANLAAKQAALLSGEQFYETSRRNLVLAMGLSNTDIATIPEANEPFPPWLDRQPPDNTQVETLTRQALARRADLHARHHRGEALDLQLLESHDRLRAALDLQLSTGYNSLELGSSPGSFLDSPLKNLGGTNYSVGLSYRFSMGNRQARGQFTQVRAEREIHEINTKDLERTIAANISQTIGELRRDFLELKAFEEAIGYYELSLKNERKKLRLGFSTLIDVINVEDRLTAVQQSYINSQAHFIKSLANLRFETGTVLDENDTFDAISPEKLISWPSNEP